MQHRGVLRTTELRQRRGRAALVLALLLSSGLYAIAGCGTPFEVADPISEDGVGQPAPCHNRPLLFGDLERVNYSGVTTGVRNPFVTQDEQLFFGEVPSTGIDAGVDAVVGRRGSGDVFQLERVLTVRGSEEITPAGFDDNTVVYRDPLSKKLRVRRKTKSGWTDDKELPDSGDAPSTNERWPSCTTDGTLLLFYREGGDGGASLVQMTRPVGGNFGNAKTVSAGGLPKGFSYPTITPDGLGLIFTLDGKTHHVKRPSREDVFKRSDVVEIEIVHAAQVLARSMSADGCRLYVTVFDSSGAAEPYVAKRK